MNTLSIGSQSRITHAGTIARTCLAPGQSGSVLAVFSKAIYLQTEAGELFWITTDDAPMHRRCAHISSPLPSPTVGSQFHAGGQSLIVDRVLTCDMEQASEWREPYTDQIVDIESLFSGVHTFSANLDYSQARGFGVFIPSILSLCQEVPANLVSEPADPILPYARPSVMSMAYACLEHQTASISQNAELLVGLGMGLTPSGDDFLGGMFFALKALQPYTPDMVSRKYLPDLEPYRLRTHLISFTLLNDLANGHAVAPLHHILNGLISGIPAESIHPFVSKLTRIGHSTGWDLLAGLLTGLLTTYRSHYFIPSFQLTKSMEV